MTYVSPDFKTKRELKHALTHCMCGHHTQAHAYEGERSWCPVCNSYESGCGAVRLLPVKVFEPGLGSVPRDGEVFLEGPHFPAAHTWYAEGTMKDGKLVKVK